MLDIREILRRLQSGQGDRAVARDLNLSRKTVTKYRTWAARRGLLAGPLPEPAALLAELTASGLHRAPPPVVFRAAPYRERIEALRRQGVECRAILERLREEVGFTGSYSGLWRYVRSLEPPTPEAYLRIETDPGVEAQVDFGTAGSLLDPSDGAVKKAWAFVMTLSWSRHQ